MNSSVAGSTLTLSCTVTTIISRTFSSSQAETWSPFNTSSSSPPPAQGNRPLLSGSVNSPVLGTSDKWDRAVLVPLCLACFSQHKVLNAHPCVIVCLYNILFIQSFIEGHLIWFGSNLEILFLVIKVALNIHM